MSSTEPSKAEQDLPLASWHSRLDNIGPEGKLSDLKEIRDTCPDTNDPQYHWLDGFIAGREF